MIPTSSQVFFSAMGHPHVLVGNWGMPFFYTILDEINLLINEIGEKVYSDLG